MVVKTHGFGQRLDQVLTSRQWTQGQLATYSGVGQSHISQIIRGLKTPRLDVAAALARALDVSLDWLAGLPPREPGALEPDEEELLKAYKELDDAHQGVVLNMTRGLGEKR